MMRLEYNQFESWRDKARKLIDSRDWTPEPHQVADTEDLFGALISTGHSVMQAARFIVEYGNDRL